MFNHSLYGNFRTRTFSDIWPDVETFKDELYNSPFGFRIVVDEEYAYPIVSDENLELLFYLLYAKYGNSHVSSSDENQFKFKVMSVIFQHGPVWQKRLEVQKNLREMTTAQIIQGGKDVYNHAYNPSTVPSEEIIDNINEQNTANRQRSLLDGYSYLLTLLSTDVTEDFLREFKKLFITIVYPRLPLWYVSDEEEN